MATQKKLGTDAERKMLRERVKPKLDKQPQQSEPDEEIDDCKCDEIDDGGECEQCERKSIKAYDEFAEPHYRKFKAYIDDTRELVRDKNGKLPDWWERFDMARSDEHCHFVMEKFNQSTD